MSGHDHGAAGFEQFARQAWSAFGDAARNLGQGTQLPGWQDGLAWWTRMLSPQNSALDGAVGRMQAQAGDWFGRMQQLAAQFAGSDAGPEQIARAWQSALADAPGAPGLAALFKPMIGAGLHGFDQWFAQVAPWLGMLRTAGPSAAWHEQASATLRMPTFGVAREHQERWQALLRAQLEHEQANAAFNDLLVRIGRRAFERFESMLEERSEPGRQLDSARALFDVWIDATEEAWAQFALTEEFRRTYGTLANAQMRLRQAVQREIEQVATAFGMPTRTEMDASHRKVAALERELRALRRELDAADVDRTGRSERPASGNKKTGGDAAPRAPESSTRKRPTRTRATAAAGGTATAAARGAKPATARQRAATAARRSGLGILPTVTAPRGIEPQTGKASARKKKARK